MSAPVITLAMLKGACGEQRAIFRKEWPNGAEATLENVLRAFKLTLDMDGWGAVHLFTAPARNAYHEAVAPARNAYHEAVAPAWKAYREAVASAWKAYDEAVAPAWKAYREAVAPAWLAAYLASVGVTA